jgi:hypothetical protein
MKTVRPCLTLSQEQWNSGSFLFFSVRKQIHTHRVRDTGTDRLSQSLTNRQREIHTQTHTHTHTHTHTCSQSLTHTHTHTLGVRPWCYKCLGGNERTLPIKFTIHEKKRHSRERSDSHVNSNMQSTKTDLIQKWTIHVADNWPQQWIKAVQHFPRPALEDLTTDSIGQELLADHSVMKETNY